MPAKSQIPNTDQRGTRFFATRRQVVDSWSTRVASYRTSEILSVRRLDEVASGLRSA